MIATRTKHHWTVTLQRESGEILEHAFSSYWDPTQEGTKEAVMNAAPIEAMMQTRPVVGPDGKPRRVLFAPISAQYHDPAKISDEELLTGDVAQAG